MNSLRRIDVFFYGLFMDAGLLQSKGVTPMNPRVASVRGFTLRVGERATLIPDPGGQVYGILMAVSHADIDRLYSDPSVSAYRPEAVVAYLSNGSPVPALCFNLPAGPGPSGANLDYAERLRELGRRLGFPSGYIEDIR